MLIFSICHLGLKDFQRFSKTDNIGVYIALNELDINCLHDRKLRINGERATNVEHSLQHKDIHKVCFQVSYKFQIS